jgi:hypothetical protein
VLENLGFLALTGCVTLGIVIASFFVGMAFLFGDFDHHANDAELIHIFTTHRSTFDRLVAMSNSDSNFSRIARDFTGPDSTWKVPPTFHPLSKDRWNEYRATFDTLHLKGGLYRSASGDTVIIGLIAWSQGLASEGTSKGYVFSRTPLTPVFSSLDRASTFQKTDDGVAYRAIAPNWYLEYDW